MISLLEHNVAHPTEYIYIFDKKVDLRLVHVIWTEREMKNLVLHVCIDFFS